MCKVTLAIPVYNDEKYIEQALLSALNQTYSDMEILLVDDCGSDSSMQIVNKVVARHKNGYKVRILRHDQNRGIGSVRNTAINHAKGNYLFFMDADDEITKECISLHVRAIEKYDCEFTCSSSDYVKENGEIKFYKNYKQEEIIIADKYEISMLTYSKKLAMQVPLWNRLYNLHFLKENGIMCIPEASTEDVWFTWQLLLKATSCCLIPDITYHYYQRQGSLSNFGNRSYENVIKSNQDKIETLKLMKKSYLEETAPKYVKQLLYINIISRVYSYLRQMRQERLLNKNEVCTFTNNYQDIMKDIDTVWTFDLHQDIRLIKIIVKKIFLSIIIKLQIRCG